jgi:catechol 2,3-dioxygenase-like lactoylglutathione lyase family enzyme
LPDGGAVVGFEHVGLSVADLAAMSEWYESALGLEPEGDFEVDGRRLSLRGRILARDGFKVELIEARGSEPDPMAGADPGAALARRGIGHVCLRVEGVDAVYESLLESGATPMVPPRPSFLAGWRYAYVADPEGNLIELMESL